MDFHALRSLSDDGIDMSFLDSLEKKYYEYYGKEEGGKKGEKEKEKKEKDAQGILDENAAIIKTITEYQEMGKVTEAEQYQRTLHSNLMHLTSIDALKSLSDDGIDMSFLEEKYYKVQ